MFRSLMRLHMRRTFGLWQQRLPVLRHRRAVVVAIAVLSFALIFMSLGSIAVTALIQSSTSTDDVATGMVSLSLLLCLAQLRPSRPFHRLRGIVVDPALEQMVRLPCNTTTIVTTRLIAHELPLLVAVLVFIFVPFAIALFVMTGIAPALRYLVVATTSFVLATSFALIAAAPLFRALVRLPLQFRAILLLSQSIVLPVLSAVLVVLVGGEVISSAATGALFAEDGAGDRLREFVFGNSSLAVVGAGTILAGALVPLLMKTAIKDVDLIGARDRLAEGIAVRRNKRFSARTSMAMCDRDIRLLARRGPESWDFIGSLAELLPAISLVAIAWSSIPQLDSTSDVVIGVAATGLIYGYFAIASETLTLFGNVDADGPVTSVLRAQPSLFNRLLDARAVRQSLLLFGTCLMAILVFSVAGGDAVPGWLIICLVAQCGLLCLVESVVLVSATARFGAIIRPTTGAPEPEPQVRMLCTMATMISTALASPLLILARVLPVPDGAAGALLSISFAVVIALALTKLVPIARKRAALESREIPRWT